MAAWLVPALVLGAWQDVANHAVLQQAAVRGGQPGLLQFCHTDRDEQRVDGDSVKAPQAGRVPDPQWFYQSRSRRW